MSVAKEVIMIALAVAGSEKPPSELADMIVQGLRRKNLLRERTKNTIEISIQGVKLQVEATESEMKSLRFALSEP